MVKSVRKGYPLRLASQFIANPTRPLQADRELTVNEETGPPSDEPENADRRCFRCFRPRALCYCDSIPSIANQTQVVILQHRREQFHPFNTARIVARALQRSRLIANHTPEISRQFDSMRLSDRVGILYPGKGSRDLSDLTPDERPDQLVVIDGTWHHAKTLMRDIPRLQTIPRYRLSPESPGRYRIRREPNEHALSTLEATVAALRVNEPETRGLDELLGVFEQMIDSQIGRSEVNWRRNERRRVGMPNIPKSISDDLPNIVVAYGEHERGGHRPSREEVRTRQPVYWVAKRLGSGERFQCAITPRGPLDDAFLDCIQLDAEDFADARSPERFADEWKNFLKPTDTLAVFHSSTARLLKNVRADACPVIILKSIDLPGEQPASLEALLQAQGITATPHDGSRAAQRLANAEQYVRYLHSIAG